MYCANNLKQLHTMMWNYAAMHRGSFPRERGEDFWLSLSRADPPLFDTNVEGIFRCPVRGGAEPGIDYRGPRFDMNELADGDVIGADKVGNHGEDQGGNVILKSGEVRIVDRTDLYWHAASFATRP